jgi:hypothetical protein
MIFSRWRRRIAPFKNQFHRPTVCVLEDRTVPTSYRLLFPPVAPPADLASHFQVTVPGTVHAGQAFTVVVEAEDAGNHIATNYSGTVQITLGITDESAKAPASVTFSAANKGVHSFQITLATAGSQIIEVNASANPTIAGSAWTTVTAARSKVMAPGIVIPDVSYGIVPAGYELVGQELVLVPNLSSNFASPISGYPGNGFAYPGYELVGQELVLVPNLSSNLSNFSPGGSYWG